MQIDQTPERLVVRHRARAAFIMWMGYVGLVLLPISILLALVNLFGSGGLSWVMVVVSFLYGVFGVALLLRAPLALEIVADRATQRVVVRRVFRFRADAKDVGFPEIRAVETRGAAGSNMAVVICALRLTSGGAIDLVDEGGFAAAQSEVRELAEKLAGFVGVGVERS